MGCPFPPHTEIESASLYLLFKSSVSSCSAPVPYGSPSTVTESSSWQFPPLRWIVPGSLLEWFIFCTLQGSSKRLCRQYIGEPILYSCAFFRKLWPSHESVGFHIWFLWISSHSQDGNKKPTWHKGSSSPVLWEPLCAAPWMTLLALLTAPIPPPSLKSQARERLIKKLAYIGFSFHCRYACPLWVSYRIMELWSEEESHHWARKYGDHCDGLCRGYWFRGWRWAALKDIIKHLQKQTKKNEKATLYRENWLKC